MTEWIESYKNSKTNVVMDYYNKKIMAPMVRVGTYPFRVQALRHGCDIAYSEELIDLKLMRSTRVVNEKLKTIDFIAKDSTLCYRTSEIDNRNVLQLGTASSKTALEAATVVANDICALDINMGCPKFFSVQGGMGSALLSQPETIKDILSTLKRNLSIPITCKIRLLSTDQATIDLLKIIESTGVSAIAIHCRTIPERPRDPAHWDRLESIMNNCSFGVPIIANGDIFAHQDIESVFQKTKVNSVMIARGAIKNVSIFSKPTPLDLKQIIQEYIEISYQTDNSAVNTKFVVTNMINENLLTTNKEAKLMQSARDYNTITQIWEMNDKYKQYLIDNNINEDDNNTGKKVSKKVKLDNNNNNNNENGSPSSKKVNKKQKVDPTINENKEIEKETKKETEKETEKETTAQQINDDNK